MFQIRKRREIFALILDVLFTFEKLQILFVIKKSLTQPSLYFQIQIWWVEAATGGVMWKKVFLEISQKACNFIKKETLVQVFSCEFCEISKNTFSYRTPPVAASDESTNKCLKEHSKVWGIFW